MVTALDFKLVIVYFQIIIQSCCSCMVNLVYYITVLSVTTQIPYFLKQCPVTLGKLAISKVPKFENVPFLCTKLFCKRGYYSRGTLFKGGHYFWKYVNNNNLHCSTVVNTQISFSEETSETILPRHFQQNKCTFDKITSPLPCTKQKHNSSRKQKYHRQA